MRLFQGLLFLFFGLGIMVMVFQARSSGWLPFGSHLFRKLEISRDTNPLGFWLLSCAYGCAGIALSVFAVRLLLGLADPLPLNH